MAAGRPGATISIADSQFVGNGACGYPLVLDALSHRRAGDAAWSRIPCSRAITGAMRSAARWPDLDGVDRQRDRLRNDAAPGYLVELPSGGSLLMQRNSLEWLPARVGRDAAVFVAAGWRSAGRQGLLVLRNNLLSVRPCQRGRTAPQELERARCRDRGKPPPRRHQPGVERRLSLVPRKVVSAGNV